MRFSIPIATPITLLILMAFFLVYLSCESASEASKTKTYDAPPPFSIDTTTDFSAVFKMENGKTFTVDLYEKRAPKTVNNFVFLANDGYYDDTTFHRGIDGFMAQGGDPTGTGSGSPGYYFDNELHVDARHDSEGVISMANKGLVNGKGTNGSQFFITFSAQEFLDGFDSNDELKDCALDSIHSVFGKVISGMDVVKTISRRDPGTAKKRGDAIRSITIKSD